MHFSKRVWIFLIIVFIVAAGGVAFFLLLPKMAGTLRRHELTVGSAHVTVEVADTMASRARGLSGHPPLGEQEGMLFIFSSPGNNAFWMKDMTFALDFVWIKGDQVVGVTEHVPPPAPGASILSLSLYYPPSPVDRVLEINEGLVARYGIKTGDHITLR